MVRAGDTWRSCAGSPRRLSARTSATRREPCGPGERRTLGGTRGSADAGDQEGALPVFVRASCGDIESAPEGIAQRLGRGLEQPDPAATTISLLGSASAGTGRECVHLPARSRIPAKIIGTMGRYTAFEQRSSSTGPHAHEPPTDVEKHLPPQWRRRRLVPRA